VRNLFSEKMILLALAAMCICAGQAYAAEPEVWVATTGSDENPGTEALPFLTIQKGIDTVDAGGTVNVAAGTYSEDVIINKNVTLLSVDGRDSTTIEGVGGSLGSIVVTNNTTGVCIGASGQGFTIIGVDGPAGLEKAAIYFQGAHSNTLVEGNNIVANGDAALLTEWGAAIVGLTINDNTISGKTFVGDYPAGEGFAEQFTLPNVPRALVVIDGSNKANITFTNNQITGTAGGYNDEGKPQGNTLISIAAAGATISGNHFAGTTSWYSYSLRCRGTANVITGNEFSSVELLPYASHVFLNEGTVDGGALAVLAVNTFDKAVAIGNVIYTSLQSVIDIAPAGATIEVPAGTYAESLAINKALHIKGADAENPPLIELPDGDNAGVLITASNVTLESLDISKTDVAGWSNSLVAVNRGGSWPTFTVAYSNVTFRNVNFTGGQTGMFVTADNLTVENCSFNGQTNDAIYLNAVSGTTNITGNTFAGATDSHKAVLFENFSSGDPAVSGTVNITGNTSTGKSNFLLYNQWIDLETKVEINVTGNSIAATGGVAIEIFDPTPWGGDPAYATKFSAFNANLNTFVNIPSGKEAIKNTSSHIVVNALYNYWGSANGPADPSGTVEMPEGGEGTAVAAMLNTAPAGELGDAVSDNVDYFPWAEAEIYSGTSDVAVNADWAGKSAGDLVLYDGTSYIFGTNAFATIQEGINAVTNSTVYVAAGIYPEEVSITKSVNLLGAQAGVDPRAGGRTEGDAATESIIDGGAGARQHGIYIKGADSDNRVISVVVDGFEIRNAYYANIRLDYADQVTVRNTVVHGCTSNEGIKTKASCDQLTFQKVISHSNVGDGIELGDYGTHTNHLIEDCVARDNLDRGIYLVGASNCTVRRSVCSGNLGTVGNWHQGGIITYGCDATTITDNECYGNAGAGITIYKENYAGATSSSVNGTNVCYDNVAGDKTMPGDGIILYLSSNVTVDGAECYGNAGRGIAATTVGNYGQMSEPCANNTLTSNNLHDNAGAGIAFEGATTTNCQAYGNTLAANSPNGLDNTTSGTNLWDNGVDTGNTWDDFAANPGYPVQYDVPGTAGNVDRWPTGYMKPPFDVIYVDAATGDDANGGFDPANAKKTIQAGIGAVADGGTVHVAAGPYSENLSIASSKAGLSLIGESRDTTVLTPVSGTAITTSAPVSITGFHILQTVGGTAISIPNASANATAGSPALVEDCIIESNPAARGNGIVFSDYNINYWNIRNNIFINRALTIYLNHASHMEICGNTITGWKEGIGTNWSGEAAHDLTITGNTFGATDFPFNTGDAEQKAAIMLGMVSYNVTISDNTFADTPNGIRVPFKAGAVEDLSNVHINLNNFSGSTYYAVLNEAAGALDATNNWWGSYAGPGATDGGGRTGDAVSGLVTTDPVTLGQYGVDSDGDGTADDLDTDDDDDGFTDAQEVAVGSDPLDANSAPFGFDLAGSINMKNPCATAEVGDWMQVGPLGPNDPSDWGDISNYFAPDFMPQNLGDLDMYGVAMEGTLESIDGGLLTYSGEYWINPEGYDYDTKDLAIESGTFTMTIDATTGATSGTFIADSGTMQPPGWPVPVDFDLANPGVFTGSVNCTTGEFTIAITGAADSSGTPVLTLNAADVYAQPGETVTVTLDVTDLIGAVNGAQAIAMFHTSHLTLTGIAQGGDDWDTLIYPSSIALLAPGEIDVAVGVKDSLSVTGTKADATLAVFTFTAGAEGQTILDFRDDIDEIESTMLGDITASAVRAVYPVKVSSPTIYIDGTAPTITQFSADPATWTNADSVALSFAATDDNAGIATYELSVAGVDGGAFYEIAETSPYTLDVSTLADGQPDVTLRVTDNAGNAETASIVLQLDKTAPTELQLSADKTDWINQLTDGPIVLTFSADGAESDIKYYELKVDGGNWSQATSTHNLNVSGLADGTHTVYMRATDNADNTSGEVSVEIKLDATPPVIESVACTQYGVGLLPGTPNAVQDEVEIVVTVSDAMSGIPGTPTVTVTPNGAAAEDITATATGSFTYTFDVISTTANGLATITITAVDEAGNTTMDSSNTFNINKNQVAGNVELEGFVGETRTVTFVITHGTGTTSVDLDVDFTGTVGAYRLTDLPDDVSAVSAKAAWNLRVWLDAALDEHGQATADFTASNLLRGGDLNDTNSINILDYSEMKIRWFSTDAVADINGDGSVSLDDYTIMKANWFTTGDPE